MGDAPTPYPPACRPQAWSAAVSPALVAVLFGLDADVPAGRLSVAPLAAFGAATVTGVRLGTETISLAAGRSGVVTAEGTALTVDQPG